MVETIFWFALFLVVYTYFIYPVILVVLNLFLSKPIDKEDITPSVSLIITAYNEEKNIRKKIEDTLNLDYPENKLEIIIASDCSTDKTDEIVKEYEAEGVRLIRLQERRGKTAAQNKAVQNAIGEILIFSDATTIYENDVIKKLVRNYNDASVGCISGDIIFKDEGDVSVGRGGALYWRYESKIKQLESSIGSILGASGCIYSMRKCLYTPYKEELISDFISPMQIVINSNVDDDFLTPMKIYIKGVRSVMEPEAISYEKASRSNSEEFRMRSRVITRAITGIVYLKEIVNPFKYFTFSFQLISHKIIRWLVPCFLIIIFVSNLFLLESELYYIFLKIQLLFYIFAFLGFAIDKLKLPKIIVFFIPYYFCFINLAALYGITKYVIGKRDSLWTPQR